MHKIGRDFYVYKTAIKFPLLLVPVDVVLKKKKPIVGLYIESFNHLFVRAFSSVHLIKELRLVRLMHPLKFALVFVRCNRYGGPSRDFADNCTYEFALNDHLYQLLIYVFHRILLSLPVDIYRTVVPVTL